MALEYNAQHLSELADLKQSELFEKRKVLLMESLYNVAVREGRKEYVTSDLTPELRGWLNGLNFTVQGNKISWA